MAMFKIEKKVQVPPQANGSRKAIYPFKAMSVGDSFFVPQTTTDGSTVRTSAYSAGKMLNRTFITRKDKDGIRVWRTK
jgi:hypothetical protein